MPHIDKHNKREQAQASAATTGAPSPAGHSCPSSVQDDPDRAEQSRAEQSRRVQPQWQGKETHGECSPISRLTHDIKAKQNMPCQLRSSLGSIQAAQRQRQSRKGSPPAPMQSVVMTHVRRPGSVTLPQKSYSALALARSALQHAPTPQPGMLQRHCSAERLAPTLAASSAMMTRMRAP